MNQYVTTTQLASMFGVTRDVMVGRLIEAGLCSDSRSPTVEAIQEGLCRVRRTWGSSVIVLWDREPIHLMLTTARKSSMPISDAKRQTRQTVRSVIATARSIMEWGEIVEVVIAMKADEQGIHARVI